MTTRPMRLSAARLSAAVTAALAAPAILSAQACLAPGETAGGGGAQPMAAVHYLSADALEGRLAGTPAERCAGDYIAAELRRIGLSPAGDDGTFFQSFSLASAMNPHAPGGTGRNVVAMLEGADPALRAEAVVIGAHYDHLGRGPMFSLAPEEAGAIHNGADDNASGVGALLAVAERLARGPRPARSVVFVAFTGEEFGLLGSGFFAENAPVPLERVSAMLNLDMVGRLGDGPLIVYGTETAEEWGELLGPAAAAAGVSFQGNGDGFGASDHTSFYARDVPVLHFFTNVHGEYHRPSDDVELIDAPGLLAVTDVVTRVARGVADRPARLTLRRGAGTPPSQQASMGGSGAYLGTVPDYAPAERGVRLSGVRDGSPAAAAGLRPGDVIVRFGEHEVGDLYDYTDALRAHKPGDSVRITVLREGGEATVTAVLGSRGGQ